MSWRSTGVAVVKGIRKGGKPPDPIKTWNIEKGDIVQLLAGRDKGKQGKVVTIDRKHNRLYVKGMNTHIIHMKSAEFTGKMQREAPLHYSNVALVDPEDNNPCRIKYMYTEDGERVRVSRRSGRIIPYPVEEKDFTKEGMPDGPYDTESSVATRATFIPSLVSFEEELAEKFGNIAISTTTQNDTSPSN